MIVGGPLCESGDIFTQEEGGFVSTRRLPEAKVGDLLVIECAGAYGFVMGSNYNSRPLAAEVLIRDGRPYLIRRRQTFDDLIRGEEIPARYDALVSEEHATAILRQLRRGLASPVSRLLFWREKVGRTLRIPTTSVPESSSCPRFPDSSPSLLHFAERLAIAAWRSAQPTGQIRKAVPCRTAKHESSWPSTPN